MTTSTLLNVGSVSKLVTATAVMLLVEEGRVDLDAEVGRYLPFAVRHPAGGEVTVRRLLAHAGGIRDSAAYGASYACGDPSVSLAAWLEGYLVPGGRFHSSESFTDHAAGEGYEYSNVGYGLLGFVVERVTGVDFAQWTRRRLFEPLGMDSSGWRLSDVDRARHATPYWIAGDRPPDPDEAPLLPAGSFAPGERVPLCLYSFPNYPDGLLRTTIEDLAAFARATLPGTTGAPRLLADATRREIFRDQLPDVDTGRRLQGLGWRRTESETLGALWGHGGADPGVRAHVLHRPEDGVTVLVMTNALLVEELRPVIGALFAAGAASAR